MFKMESSSQDHTVSFTQPTEETLCQSKQNTLLNPQTSDENKETKSENKAEYGGACLIPALGEQRHKD